MYILARKFRKNGQIESIAANLQNTPIYYVNYKKKEDGVNARVVRDEDGTLLQRGRKTEN